MDKYLELIESINKLIKTKENRSQEVEKVTNYEEEKLENIEREIKSNENEISDIEYKIDTIKSYKEKIKKCISSYLLLLILQLLILFVFKLGFNEFLGVLIFTLGMDFISYFRATKEIRNIKNNTNLETLKLELENLTKKTQELKKIQSVTIEQINQNSAEYTNLQNEISELKEKKNFVFKTRTKILNEIFIKSVENELNASFNSNELEENWVRTLKKKEEI